MASALTRDDLEELRRLRAFAQDIMKNWPENMLDSIDLQNIAAAHGLLRPEVRGEPCGKYCGCLWAVGESEFPLICYRTTELLKGRDDE